MNKLLQSIKAGEEEFIKKYGCTCDEREVADHTRSTCNGALDIGELRTVIRSNTIKLLEEQIKWLEGKRKALHEDCYLDNCGFCDLTNARNEVLDETISMLRETIKELTNQSHG